MSWGVKNETFAVAEAWKYFKARHLEPQRHQVGLCMDKYIKILSASPDCILVVYAVEIINVITTSS